MIGLVAVTAAGRRAADELSRRWPGETRTYTGGAAASLPTAFGECEGIVAFLATGVAVRVLAPLLTAKAADPGVVCVDEARRFAVALVGGHAGGANALAVRVADVLGAQPVTTTATDAVGFPALDALADTMGWLVEPGSDVAGVGAAVLDGRPVALVTEETWPLPALPPNVVPGGRDAVAPAIVVSDRQDLTAARGRVVYRPRSVVAGVGASTGAPAGQVRDLLTGALAEAGLSPLSLRALATVDRKAHERGIVDAARELGVPLLAYPAEALAACQVPNPSAVVERAVGTPSVAEAAAVCGGAALVLPKRKSAAVTVALARVRPRGRLAIVGLGPGARDLLTPRARAELCRASIVVGLDQYVGAVRDLLPAGADVRSSGLGAERERARTAVAAARAGHAVALLGSGDAGIYAMAGPALQELGDAAVDVVGVPGIPAMVAAAAVLGAPLGHDHAAISLSDLHTPWPVIEGRVAAAAAADYVIAFYNPKSRDRDWQLRRALEVVGRYRCPDTPVGVVRQATRPGERREVTTLADLELSGVDMLTIVLVGSSATRVVGGRMVTPRGYRWSS